MKLYKDKITYAMQSMNFSCIWIPVCLECARAKTGEGPSEMGGRNPVGNPWGHLALFVFCCVPRQLDFYSGFCGLRLYGLHDVVL